MECPVSFDGLRSVLAGAAAVVVDVYSGSVRVDRKEDGSPITRADLRANDFLRRSLQELLPAGWLSEETVDDTDRLAREWVWVVDPGVWRTSSFAWRQEPMT